MSESATSKQANLAIGAAAIPQQRPAASLFDTHPIGHEFRDAVENAKQLSEVIRSVAELVGRETECLALWISQRDATGEQLKTHPLTDAADNPITAVVGDALPKLIQQTIESGTLSSTTVGESYLIVASSIATAPQRTEMVLSGCFLRAPDRKPRQSWMLKIGSQAIEQWIFKNELQRTRNQARTLSDSLSLCSAMDGSTSKQEAANYLVNHLRRLLEASQVVYCDGSKTDAAKLLAISEVEQFDPHSESSKTILSAARACVGVSEPVIHCPKSSTANPLQAIAIEAYCKANRFTSCVGLPTQNSDGSATGILLVASTAESFSEPQLNQLTQIASIHGAHLDVVRRANLRASELFSERMRQVPKKSWFGVAWKAAIGFAVLMCVPWPYRVACDCDIQPVTRRFVSAPYTGPLEKSVVRPGEVVTKGQVLALMDGKQLRHELTGVEAEYQAAKRRRGSALAMGEVAQSQIARSESRKLETQIKSLKDQLSRLEIRSPYDGIVVSGDLDKAQGATMEIGQTLFEVAPLDDMLAEVAIPESEIQYVQQTQSVAIKLNAFPYRTFYGEVDSINPGAEILGDESVFVANVKLIDEQSVIRPGMKGSAKVKTGYSPIGWNLFHNAWESVRCWLVW